MLVGLRAVVVTLVVVGSVGCSQDVSRSENEETSISEIEGACAEHPVLAALVEFLAQPGRGIVR